MNLNIRRILCKLQVSVCNIYVFHTELNLYFMIVRWVSGRSQSNRTNFNDKLGMLSFEMRINRTFGEWKFESDTNDTRTHNKQCDVCLRQTEFFVDMKTRKFVWNEWCFKASGNSDSAQCPTIRLRCFHLIWQVWLSSFDLLLLTPALLHLALTLILHIQIEHCQCDGKCDYIFIAVVGSRKTVNKPFPVSFSLCKCNDNICYTI